MTAHREQGLHGYVSSQILWSRGQEQGKQTTAELDLETVTVRKKTHV